MSSTCDQAKEWMMRVIDHQASAEHRQALDTHLQSCQSCAAEFADFRHTKDVTDRMRSSMEFDAILDAIESGVLARVQRSLAWLLSGAGLMLIVCWSLVDVLLDESVPMAIRIGISMLGTGSLLFIIETVRWRRRTAPHDPYRSVIR